MKKRKFLCENEVLLKEWHPTLNGDLDPKTLTAGSQKKPYWQCSKGHVWQAMIRNRSNGKGCRKCWIRGLKAITIKSDNETL